MKQVEDIKGNPGERGTLSVTNLRVIWQSDQHDRTNISIGLESVEKCIVQMRHSKVLMASIRSLFVCARNGKGVYQFHFGFTLAALSHYKQPLPLTGEITSWLSYLSVRVSTVFEELLAEVKRSNFYRNVCVHSLLLKPSGEFDLLPDEELYETLPGVTNLSLDEGVVGVFYITTIRIAWHAYNNGSFSVSLPYLQIDSVRSRQSKFGHVLVIDATPKANGYMLGFRIDPEKQCKEIAAKLRKYWVTHRICPNFGVSYKIDEAWKPLKSQSLKSETTPVERKNLSPNNAKDAEDYAFEQLNDPADQLEGPSYGLTESEEPLATIDLLFAKTAERSVSLIPLVPSEERLAKSDYAVYLEAGNLVEAKTTVIYDSYTGLCIERSKAHDGISTSLLLKRLWRGHF